MFSVDIILAFITASTLLAFAPGPDNIFVLTQSAMNGPRAGILITLGLCTGLIVHTLAVAAGVAAIFQVSAMAFTALKVVGAAYLLYLAWGAFRADAQAIDTENGRRLSNAAFYRRGIIMNITNPKVAIFFLAFLPQFTHPETANVSLQVFALGAVFMLVSLLCFSLIAMLSGALSQLLRRSPEAQTRLNRLAGGVFAILAVKLVTSER
ncbi:LysE family translocator [Pseudoteredinibacter isoporae]|uniref:LysE family translocator n=1 Tax=Pseudoteredinibacter isoporae TaxID=570281 RepID=UPI0031076726